MGVNNKGREPIKGLVITSLENSILIQINAMGNDGDFDQNGNKEMERSGQNSGTVLEVVSTKLSDERNRN